MKTRLGQKLTQKALNYKFNEVKEAILEQAVTDLVGMENPPVKVKNLCAYVPQPIYERLEDLLLLLKMSKREFITLAVLEAMDKADQILLEIDIYEDEQEQVEVA